MNTYCLGLDTWEGSLDIDEQVLWDAGVRLIIPRLNSITGGLHKDDLFDSQWAQAERFYRLPYFVYSPWHSWEANINFLGENAPAGIRRVCIDVEVKRAGYSPAAYAADFEHFQMAARRVWNVTIYTGGWFTPYLSYWPIACDYWWARYPGLFYPETTQTVEWSLIHSKIAALTWNPACTLGECNLWQVSGDRYKLPGTCGRVVDINVWNGTRDDLAAWVGADAPPPAPERWEYAITRWARDNGYTGPDPDRM